jgi:hypothetical protein
MSHHSPYAPFCGWSKDMTKGLQLRVWREVSSHVHCLRCMYDVCTPVPVLFVLFVCEGFPIHRDARQRLSGEDAYPDVALASDACQPTRVLLYLLKISLHWAFNLYIYISSPQPCVHHLISLSAL